MGSMAQVARSISVKECGHKYTPEPKVNGYPAETRQLAVRMYVEGNSYGSVSNMFADCFKEFF